MKHRSLSVLATAITLAFAGAAQAATVSTTDNLHVFGGYRAGSPLEVLRTHADRFALPASLNNLVQVREQESLLGKHTYFQQMLHGYPVDGAEIVVSMSRSGHVLKVFNETRPVSGDHANQALVQLHGKPLIGTEAAMDRAWANHKVQHPLVAAPTSTMVWVHGKDGFQLAHKIHVAAQMPTGGFVQFINAHDGSLLKSYTTSLPRNGKGGERTLAVRGNLVGATLDRKSATDAQAAQAAQAALRTGATTQTLASGINGTGNVFDPDPRTTLNTDTVVDTSPASTFEAAYFNKPLRDITLASGVYSLTGPYVNIKNIEAPNTAPSTTTTGAWTAKRGNNAFDDTNIYFHIDQNQRYMQSLGFTGTKAILNRSMDIDSDGVNGDDNSHFSGNGSTGYLAFGHGCVNDSEDVDVILHEYGHAIHYSINSSWSGGDTGAMGEGFGDYWAASYSYSTPNGKTFHPEWAFTWDGHSSCWAGRMLNRTDAKYNSSKTYGAHASVTEGGVTFVSDELWSAPLFAAMTSLIAAGKTRENIDKIILEAHFGLGSGIKMPAMATAIVNAATNLFPTDLSYANTFKAKFVAQNILTDVVVPPGTNINETETNNTTATANTITASNTTVAGTMSSSSDVDFFKLSLPAGKTLTAKLTPNTTSDYDLYVYDSNGTTSLGSSVKGTGLVDSVSTTNSGASAKTVYVKVIRYSGGTGSTSGKYTLNATW